MKETNEQIGSFKGYTSAFTIDVEDGVSIAMRDAFNQTVKQTDRVVKNTRKILDLLAAHNTRGTFFILGQVAKDFPELVKAIASQGHEIGVHGYHHLVFSKMSSELAFEELDAAKKILEDLTGNQVFGHRAPAFSITPKTAWGLDVIARCGFQYDSSVLPADFGPFTWPNFSKDMAVIQSEKFPDLIEIPISIMPFMGKSVPFSGGSYLRLFPFWLVNKEFKRNTQDRPSVLYIHPYELDVERYPDYYFKAMRTVSWTKQLKMRSYWLKRGQTLSKLDRLLKRYSFEPMIEIIDRQRAEGSINHVNLDRLTLESPGS